MIDPAGRYKIEVEIGQGGFATVYRGRDTALNRLVALKELRPILLRDEKWVKQFLKEARTIAQLDHPHIVSVFDIYETDSRLFIVMRLAEGPSLEEYLAQHGPLSLAETSRHFEKIAVALDHAHQHGVLHRDLKPANILMDPERGPVLTDFGLARLTNDLSLDFSDSNNIAGTPNYIAPEIWEGQPATPQTDIYALGCVLYEMLTGEKLFQGQTPLAVMKAHFNQIDLPQRWPGPMPPGLESIFATALAENPAYRFKTADDMAQALAELSRQPSAHPTPAPGSALGGVPLLTTKFYSSASRAHLVARPRLTQRLQHGWQSGCKLTLVVAPAGFGKSTLVSCWLTAQQNRQPQPPQAAWLSLDESDNDPARFLTYLITALQKIEPAVGQKLIHTPRILPAEMVATTLINDLTTIAEPFVLVLDDYHLIGSGFIHEVIEFLLERQPPHMHLVLVTREDPPLPLPRLRARAQISEIRQDDLRFTTAEAVAFLNDTMNLNLTTADIQTLEERTEGWIAGLQLAALSLQGRQKHHIVDFLQDFSGSHRYVIDYLIEEVVLQQPQNIRQFLRHTAVLDRFSAELCNSVTGLMDSQLILSYLEQVNLFLIPLDDQRKWYRYHKLFAEFLVTELSAAERQSLCLRAARWFEGHGYLPDAIKYTLAANSTTEAGRLIKLAADSALHQSAFFTLAGWLDALPDDLLETDGELATYKGWTEWIIGNMEAAETYADIATAALPANASPSTRGKLISLQACLAVSHDANGLELAREAIPLLDETDPFFTGMALLVLSETQNLTGDTAGAIDTLNQALRLGQKHQDHLMTVGALVNLAQQLNWQGKRREAAALCRRAYDESFDPTGKPRPMLGFAYIGLAEVELHTGNLNKTTEYLERAFEFIEHQAMFGFQISAKLVAAPLAMAKGDVEQALTIAQEVHHIVKTASYEPYLPVAAAVEAEYQLQAGNLAAAQSWAHTVHLPAANEPLSVMREMELQIYARYLLATGQPAQADSVLALVESSAAKNERGLILLTTYLLQALTWHVLKRPAEVKERLTAAVKRAAPEQYQQIFVQEGPPLLQLLPQVRQAAPAFIDAVLQLAGQQLPTEAAPADTPALPAINVSAGAPQPLPEPLTDRELEVLQLIAAGQSNKEAAATLVVTVGTVKKHLSNIFGKLNVNSRTQAVARARELDLIQ